MKKFYQKQLRCRLTSGPRYNTAGLLLLLFMGFGTYAQTIRYVKQGGTGSGATWALASGDVQAMITASSSGDEVWVAAGEYQRGSGQYFTMKEGVKIYGGFPATGSPVFANRNWTANVTKLKGNNSTVVYNSANGLTNAAVLDGFTLYNGSAFNQGGAMHNYQVSPTISNLIVRDNHAIDEGGGIYMYGGTPVFTNITIINNTVGTIGVNTAKRGGGFYNYDGSPTLKNVLVANNTMYGTGALGGGINLFNGNGVLINVTVTGNTAATGSGMYFQGWGSPQVKNAIIWNNNIVLGGGVPTFTNSLVTGSGGSSSWNSSYGTNGGNNIDADPLFSNAVSGDFSLAMQSPAINSGNTSFFTGASAATDLSGSPRLRDIIDMGAYETNVYAHFVTQSGSGLQDGSSWANASPDLQLMINGTLSGDQVWVAGGTYKPNRRAYATGTITPNDRDNAFVLKSDVKVYGGFAGNERFLAARDLTITTNASKLDGDFNGDDTYNVAGQPNGNNTENAYHVVMAVAAVGTAELNGFTVQGGYADVASNNIVNGINNIMQNRGGGIMIEASSPAISNVIVTKNACTAIGGGMYIDGTYGASAPILSNLSFSANSAIYGGGLGCESNAAPIINDAQFIGNATTGYGEGGGLWSYQTSSPTLRNVVFTANTSYAGAGLQTGNATLTNILIASNTAGYYGGGMAIKNGAPSLTNVTITGNDGQNGGGIHCFLGVGTVQIRNSIAWGNTAINNANIDTGSGSVYWTNCILQGTSRYGSWRVPLFGNNGGGNIDADPLFTDPSNSNFTLQPASPAVNAGNNSFFSGYATAKDLAGNPRVFNTTIDIGAYESQVIPPPSMALGVDNAALDANSIIIYKNGNTISIDAGIAEMAGITVFDMGGRLLYQQDVINNTKAEVTGLQSQQQLLIVQITTIDGRKISRKIAY